LHLVGYINYTSSAARFHERSNKHSVVYSNYSQYFAAECFSI